MLVSPSRIHYIKINGNANLAIAIFGAGATIGSNIVNGIF